MGKKGLSLEEKRQKILEIYYEKVTLTAGLTCRKKSLTSRRLKRLEPRRASVSFNTL